MPWYSDPDVWQAIFAGAAVLLSLGISVASYLKSSQAKIDAKYANDRADQAVEIAKTAQAELEKMRTIEQQRFERDAKLHEAPARAHRLIAEAKNNAAHLEVMNRQRGDRQAYQEPNWITGEVYLHDDVDCLALHDVAKHPDVRQIVPPKPPPGTRVRISFDNPKKHKR
jgi:hypothetical protein